MKLSIITINYNNRDGLQKTIDSVVAQTCHDFEWIVIDGGSTDGSKEVIEKYQEHFEYWCSERDKGIYNAMNKGIDKAKGEYLLFLNSGDILFKSNVIEEIIPYLGEHDFVATDSICHSPTGQTKRWSFENRLTAYQLFRYSLSHQSTFIHTNLLKKRRYREDLQIVSDWEQMVYELIIRNGTYLYVPIIVSVFEENGLSRTEVTRNNNERGKVLDEYFSKRVQDAVLGENELDEIVNHIPVDSKLYKCSLFCVKFVRKCCQLLRID